MTHPENKGPISPLAESLHDISTEMTAALGGFGINALADYLRTPVAMQDCHVAERRAGRLGEALSTYDFTEPQITQLIDCGVPSLQPRTYEAGHRRATTYDVWLRAADTDTNAAPLAVKVGDIIGKTYHPFQGFTAQQLLQLAIQADEIAEYRTTGQLPARYR